MFRYKVKDVAFVVVKSSIKEEKSDVLFNWTVSDLSGGDDNFIEIHKEGGSVIYKECQGQLAQFGKINAEGTKEILTGEAVITSAGILPYKRIVHCVVPNYRKKEEKDNKNSLFLSAVNYSLALVNDYSLTHLPLRKLALTPVPIRISGEFDKTLVKTFIKTLVDSGSNLKFKEIKIICKTEEEYNQYVSLFTKTFVSFWDKLYYKIFN